MMTKPEMPTAKIEDARALASTLRRAIDVAERAAPGTGQLATETAMDLVSSAMVVASMADEVGLAMFAAAEGPQERAAAGRMIGEGAEVLARARRIAYVHGADDLDVDDAEVAAIQEYLALLGHVLELDRVDCETGPPIVCDPPALARIDPPFSHDELVADLLNRRQEDPVEPFFAVVILEPHPALEGVKPVGTIGTVRDGTGIRTPFQGRIAPPEMQARYRDAEGIEKWPRSGAPNAPC